LRASVPPQRQHLAIVPGGNAPRRWASPQLQHWTVESTRGVL